MAKSTKTRRTRSSRSLKLPTPPLHSTPVRPRGSLLIIGGREAKEGDRPILEELARRAAGGSLVVATMASEEPEAQWEDYRRAFMAMGVKRLKHLDVRQREELLENPREEVLEDARVVFFAGGDQLKITSRFGGTLLCDRVRDLYQRGGTIAGTSSGASVMSETMMVSGAGEESHEGVDTLKMAPGLGFVPSLIIDQHFAERGRISRLLAAVAQNPRLIGLGIDEDTAVLFERERQLRVIGSGAVYIVDGRAITHTTATRSDGRPASIHGVIMHVLGESDLFDLQTREPRRQPQSRARKS